MNVATLKTRLYALLQPIIGGTVIWADQSVTRPALPFSTLRLGVINPIGEPHYSDVDANGIQTVLAVRESILTVQRFGVDSVASLENASDSLAKNSNLDKFSLQSISAFDVSSVTDVAALLNGISIEPRAMFELSLRWMADLTDNVGVIETVISNGEIGPDLTAIQEVYTINSTVDTTP